MMMENNFIVSFPHKGKTEHEMGWYGNLVHDLWNTVMGFYNTWKILQIFLQDEIKCNERLPVFCGEDTGLY